MKRRWIMVPVADWDMEGMESWLSDLALEGWRLSKDGFLLPGFGCFEEAVPKKLRYRLEATPYQRNLWDDNMGEPEGEQRLLCEELGWDYVCPRGQFFVYVSDDPAAPELHTEPAVQALNIRKLKQRQRDSALTLLFWCCIYPLLRLRGSVVSAALIAGLGLSLCVLLLIPLELALSLRSILSLRSLQKRLERGEEADHHKDWRRGKWLHWGTTAASLLLCGAVAWGVGSIWYRDTMRVGQMALKAYGEPLPFPLMEDLTEGDFVWEELGDWCNKIEVDGNFLAPTIIRLNQTGRIERDGVTVLDGGYEVTYLDCRFDWMAAAYARDAYRYYSRNAFREELTPLPLPELEADYAVAFTNIFPTVILAKDGKVMELEFYHSGKGQALDVAAVAAALAASF